MSLFQETLEKFQAFVLEKDTAIKKQIVGNDEEFIETRLSVYQEGYFLRLLEILGKVFPGLKNFLGEEQFEKIGREYIINYPSQTFSIRDFGQYFSKFLASIPHVEPVVVEIARFEWAMEYAIDAADAPQLTFEDMVALSPEAWASLILTTHPAVKIVPFFYPTPTLWQSLQQEKQPPDLVHSEEPTHWIIWRFNRQTRFKPMTPEQFWMMQALQNGESFSDVCTGLCELLAEDKVVGFAAQTLREWIAEGIFSEFNVAAE